MTHRVRPDGPDLLAGPGRRRVRVGGVAGVGGPLAVGAIALAAVVHLALTDPYRPGGHLVCPVLALTGFFCAGCGAQRAVHDLTQGDLAAAWGMNPLVVLAVPVAATAWARWLASRWRPGSRPAPGRGAVTAGRGATAWVLLALVVTFAVLRNVPALAPWLAP